jgi:hypothetical protein
MAKFTVEELLQQLMQGADKNYREQVKMLGTGFVVGTKKITKEAEPEGEPRTSCGIINAAHPIDSLDDLRRFAVAVRAGVKMSDGTVAGILCELDIALNDGPPARSVVLYMDQKYGGMRIYVAPKSGEHLLFRDLGVAHPTTSFLPSLIPVESYGPAISDA